MDKTLEKYSGREEVLFTMLTKKYGVPVPKYPPGSAGAQVRVVRSNYDNHDDKNDN